MSELQPQQRPSPFAYPDFRWFWTARLGSTLAQSLIVIVIGWQVYGLARTVMEPKAAAFQLGLVGLIQFLPLFLLTPVTGWAADHFDRRTIARSCCALQFAAAALVGILTVADRLNLPGLFVAAALLGVARAFLQPSLAALAPNLVPAAVMPRAIATTSIATRVGAILGPAAGGLLYGLSRGLPYAASCAALLISFVGLTLVRAGRRAANTPARRPLSQMAEGLRYVARNRLVLGAISLDLFTVLLGGATAMLPIFARDILHIGATGLGELRAAPAVGALASALWFSRRPLRRRVGLKMLIAVGVFGTATVGFGLSRSLPLSLACLTILGAADMLSVYVRQSLIQISTPDAMRGRVGAVSTLFVSASNELGEAESGFLASAVGPVGSVILGGVGAVLVTVLWAWWFPVLRKADGFEPQADP